MSAAANIQAATDAEAAMVLALLSMDAGRYLPRSFAVEIDAKSANPSLLGQGE